MKGSLHGLPWVTLWGLNHIWAQYRQISSLFKVGDIWRHAGLWSFLKLNWGHQPAKRKTHLLEQVKASLREQWASKGPSQLLRAQLDSISNANSPVEGSKMGNPDYLSDSGSGRKWAKPSVCSKDRTGTTVHSLDKQPGAPTEGMCWMRGHGHPGWDAIHSIGERPVCPSAGVWGQPGTRWTVPGRRKQMGSNLVCG